MKTTCGSSSITGSPGMNPSTRPPTTSTMGYGSDSCPASDTNTATIASKMSTNSTSYMRSLRDYETGREPRPRNYQCPDQLGRRLQHIGRARLAQQLDNPSPTVTTTGSFKG